MVKPSKKLTQEEIEERVTKRAKAARKKIEAMTHPDLKYSCTCTNTLTHNDGRCHGKTSIEGGICDTCAGYCVVYRQT